jgi:hypothetical protein
MVRSILCGSDQLIVALLLSLPPFDDTSHCPNEGNKDAHGCPWSFYEPQYYSNIRTVPRPAGDVAKEGVIFRVKDLW